MKQTSTDSEKLSIRKKRQIALLVADVVSALLVWVCFLVFRWLVYDGRIFSMDSVLIPAFGFYKPLFLYPVFCGIIYYLSGFYMRPFRRSMGRDMLITFGSSVIIALGAFFIIIIDDNVSDFHNYYVSLCTLFCLQFVFAFAGRVLVAVITGSYHHVPKVYTVKKRQVLDILNGAVVHVPADTEAIVLDFPKGLSEQDIFKVVNAVYPLGLEIMFPTRQYDLLVGAAQVRDLNQRPMVCITDLPMSDSAMCIKRAFDVVMSLILMIILSPVYAVIAIVIKADGKGPVIYRQERIGHYGRPFRILKFRTMCVDAEQETPSLATDNDPRVTRVGKGLRKYRLDELPQLWNILKGEMSIVGPRPEREYFIEKISSKAPYYCLIYKVRPGLTSWGPVRVGYTDTLEKMVRRLNYDIVYIENMSLLLDAEIMLKTFRVIVDGKGK